MHNIPVANKSLGQTLTPTWMSAVCKDPKHERSTSIHQIKFSKKNYTHFLFNEKKNADILFVQRRSMRRKDVAWSNHHRMYDANARFYSKTNCCFRTRTCLQYKCNPKIKKKTKKKKPPRIQDKNIVRSLQRKRRIVQHKDIAWSNQIIAQAQMLSASAKSLQMWKKHRYNSPLLGKNEQQKNKRDNKDNPERKKKTISMNNCLFSSFASLLSLLVPPAKPASQQTQTKQSHMTNKSP